jgi:hypothetical protein
MQIIVQFYIYGDLGYCSSFLSVTVSVFPLKLLLCFCLLSVKVSFTLQSQMVSGLLEEDVENLHSTGAHLDSS